jgi:hypothetical protein
MGRRSLFVMVLNGFWVSHVYFDNVRIAVFDLVIILHLVRDLNTEYSLITPSCKSGNISNSLNTT